MIAIHVNWNLLNLSVLHVGKWNGGKILITKVYLVTLFWQWSVWVARARFASQTRCDLPVVRRTPVTALSNHIRQAGTLTRLDIAVSSFSVGAEQVTNARYEKKKEFHSLLLPAYVVCGKVMFSFVPVCLSASGRLVFDWKASLFTRFCVWIHNRYFEEQEDELTIVVTYHKHCLVRRRFS